MEPTSREINELRTSFLKKCEEENVIATGTFHPDDVRRAKVDDDWIRRFLVHHENDQKNALNMLVETCDWRKKIGANDISEKNVNTALLEGGSVFAHGRDRDGKLLLVFTSRKHVKGEHSFEDLKRHVVYWMERAERQGKGDMISLFFDMDGARVSNMDMEYTKYLIGLFNNYYPCFLNYILIFEMTWLLTATFKIIKTWLPPKAIKKMHFVTMANLREFVDKDQALKSWGGKSEYVFSFEAEDRFDEQVVGEESRKKVHFADGSPLTERLNESGFVESETGSPTRSRLSVSPPEFLSFTYEGSDLTASIHLRNDNNLRCVSYKIKTTSPRKFRVRPSIGLLPPDSSATITVVLLPGYDVPGPMRDKFLIMGIPAETSDADSLAELWKNVSQEEVSQHKLCASFASSGKNDGTVANGSAGGTQSGNEQKLTKITSDVMKLQTSVSGLKEDVKLIQRQQWIIATAILILACIVVYVSSGSSDFKRSDQHCWVDILADFKQTLFYFPRFLFTNAKGMFKLFTSPPV